MIVEAGAVARPWGVPNGPESASRTTGLSAKPDDVIGSRRPPPRGGLVRGDVVREVRDLQQIVPSDPGQDVVVDRGPLAHDDQGPPQRADVRLGRGGVAPVVQPW